MWPDSRRFEFFDFEQCITESDCQGMAPKCQKLSCHVAIWWCQRTGTKHHRQAHWSRKDAGDRQCAIIASQVTLVVENLPANARDMGSIPRLGRAPGKGNGNTLQYSCLENHMDRGSWWATIHELTKNQTSLSTCARTHTHTSWLVDVCWLPPVGSLKTGWMSHKGTSCVSACIENQWLEPSPRGRRDLLSSLGLGVEVPSSQLHRSGITWSRHFNDQISSLSIYF